MRLSISRSTIAAMLLLFMVITPADAGNDVTPKIDRRVELMSIVARLAGYEEYINNQIKSYADDVDKHFAKYKDHPAIEYAKKVRKNGVGYDAVMSMAVHLNPPPALTARITFSDDAPARWGKERAEEFAKHLQSFYKAADCETFFTTHNELYINAEKRFNEVFQKVDLKWYQRFYGEVPAGTFNLYIGLLVGGNNFGPKVINTDKSEDLYAIIGAGKVDKDGLPIFDSSLLPTIIHEFNHSFINNLVEANRAELQPAATKVYQPVSEKMKRLAYGTPEIMIVESLVRAAVVRYLIEHDEKTETAFSQTISERNNGFIWIEDLITLMAVYENGRKTFPHFREFMPLIVGYYKHLSTQIDYRVKLFEDAQPKLKEIPQFVNGAQDVDPNITEIKLIFDRPLDTRSGLSINYGNGGAEHFPIVKSQGFDELGLSLTLQVKLKSAWDYEFVLTGLRFRTRDGYPLQNQSVKFRTK